MKIFKFIRDLLSGALLGLLTVYLVMSWLVEININLPLWWLGVGLAAGAGLAFVFTKHGPGKNIGV